MGRSLRHLQRHFVAYLALFVALGGTSLAAATAINGKQIKPHTIPKNRLTNSAISSLHGAKGAPGTQGPTGPKGPTGVAGPPGLSGYLRVSGTAVAVPAGMEGTASALCPAGEKELGGGFLTTTPNATLFPTISQEFISSAPATNGDLGWGVTMYNNGGTSASFKVSVYCAKVT
jgi:hypothetical protein